MIYFGAKNVKTRKAESVPSKEKLRKSLNAAGQMQVLETKDDQPKDEQPRFSEYVFHRDGLPVGDFRKAWVPRALLLASASGFVPSVKPLSMTSTIASPVTQLGAAKI